MLRQRRFSAPIALAVIFLTVAPNIVASGAALAQPEYLRDAPREPKPGEGVLCVWAIYALVAQVGSRCLPGESAAFQAELRRALNRFEEYVMKNSSPPLTPKQITEIKREQRFEDLPADELCNASSIDAFRSAAEKGVETLRATIDAILAVPGQPTLGDTCL